VYGTRATCLAFVALQGSDGATPPTVCARWMLLAWLNVPRPVVALASRRSQGMADWFGPGSRALTSPTTVLPSSDSHVGPA